MNALDDSIRNLIKMRDIMQEMVNLLDKIIETGREGEEEEVQVLLGEYMLKAIELEAIE